MPAPRSSCSSGILTKPLRKIVLYDGIYVQRPGGVMTQQLQGSDRSALAKDATLTHLAASGQKNPTDRLFFNGGVIATDWDDDTSTDADEYLVPSRLARGGELIQERACVPRVNGRVDGRQPTPAAKGGTTAPTRWSPATTASR